MATNRGYQPNKEWKEAIQTKNFEKVKSLFPILDQQNLEVFFFLLLLLVFL